MNKLIYILAFLLLTSCKASDLSNKKIDYDDSTSAFKDTTNWNFVDTLN